MLKEFHKHKHHQTHVVVLTRKTELFKQKKKQHRFSCDLEYSCWLKCACPVAKIKAKHSLDSMWLGGISHYTYILLYLAG